MKFTYAMLIFAAQFALGQTDRMAMPDSDQPRLQERSATIFGPVDFLAPLTITEQKGKVFSPNEEYLPGEFNECQVAASDKMSRIHEDPRYLDHKEISVILNRPGHSLQIYNLIDPKFLPLRYGFTTSEDDEYGKTEYSYDGSTLTIIFKGKNAKASQITEITVDPNLKRVGRVRYREFKSTTLTPEHETYTITCDNLLS